MARVAIVTGADSGIGKVSAIALAEAGFDVGVTWHQDPQGAEDTAAQVRSKGRRAEVRRLKLDQLPQAGDVIDALGGLDVFTSTSRGWAPPRTARPRAGWGCAPR